MLCDKKGKLYTRVFEKIKTSKIIVDMSQVLSDVKIQRSKHFHENLEILVNRPYTALLLTFTV